MDLNYLLAREQTSLIMAAAAQTSCARLAHEDMARRYGLLLALTGFPHHSIAAANDDGEAPTDQGPPARVAAQAKDR